LCSALGSACLTADDAARVRRQDRHQPQRSITRLAPGKNNAEIAEIALLQPKSASASS